MGFDTRDSATRYVPRDGDTLEAIAERETAAGNPITWQDLARYNWGTADPDAVNEHLRDELGARLRNAANDFVLSADDEARSDLLIPVRFTKGGLAQETTHTLRVRRVVAPPQFLGCCAIPGTTFAYDSSFVRPAIADHLAPLANALDQHPDAKVMIFGHTDRVGTEAYNKTLSERRAESVFAFITNDAAAWEALYQQEQWGTRAIQEILKDLEDPAFDPGPVDGVYGPKTQQAVRAYQTSRGLAPDGVAGPVTRQQLFTDYMTGAHDIDLGPDRFMEPKHMGCGEFNPVEETEAASEPNRRVTFFLFHPDRLPNLPCAHGQLAPCHRQIDPPAPRHVPSFLCSFFDSLARTCPSETTFLSIAIRILDPDREPFSGADYRLSIVGDLREGVTDGEGWLVEDHVAEAGMCALEWAAPGDRAVNGGVYGYSRAVFLDVESGSEREQSARRLHNMGYAPGDPIDPAVEEFQADYGLEPDGQLSPETVARLRQVHDDRVAVTET